jgi:hypothetical protein
MIKPKHVQVSGLNALPYVPYLSTDTRKQQLVETMGYHYKMAG